MAPEWWSHTVVAMTWIGICVALTEAALLFALFIWACVKHRTWMPLLRTSQEQEAAQEARDTEPDIGRLLASLSQEEKFARRVGNARKAEFLRSLAGRLWLQSQQTAHARHRCHEEERQLRVDAARAGWGIVRDKDDRHFALPTSPAPTNARVSPHHTEEEEDHDATSRARQSRASGRVPEVRRGSREASSRQPGCFVLAAITAAWVLSCAVTGIVLTAMSAHAESTAGAGARPLPATSP